MHIINWLKYIIIKHIRKTFNTIYFYLKGSNNILVINCSFAQWGNKLVNSNIGDDLNLVLFKSLTGKIIMNYDEFFHVYSLENVMGIGSIIDWKTNNDSIIWGSGVLHSNTNIDDIKKPKIVLSVRGKLTQQYLLKQGIECPNVFGDPALLLPVIYHKKQPQLYTMGIIPHYVDLYDPVLRDYISKHENIVLIDIKNYTSWTDIIDTIRSCNCILSSSLHGLIISDAYGVPNIWVKFSEKIKGNDFKYYDYFSSIERHDSPILFSEINSTLLDELINKYTPIHYNIKNIMQVFPFHLTDKYRYLKENDLDIFDMNIQS